MPSIYRVYQPLVDFQYAQVYQASSPLVGTQCDITLKPELNHRKVWAIVNTTNATFNLFYDLVAKVNGREVYRQPLARYSSSAGKGKQWYSGFGASSTNVGSPSENLFVKIASSSLYGLSPFRLNLACDEMYLDCVNVTSAGAIDAYLFCLSQKGI